jgi:HEAT repeat protein
MNPLQPISLSQSRVVQRAARRRLTSPALLCLALLSAGPLLAEDGEAKAAPEVQAILKQWSDTQEESRSPEQRLALAKKIADLGLRVAPELIDMAAQAGAEDAAPSHAVAVTALGLLLENDQTAAKKPAIAALLPVAAGRKNYENRWLALKALASIGDISVIPALVPTLDTSAEIAATKEILNHHKTLNVICDTLIALARISGGAELLIQEFDKHQERASDPLKVRMIQTLREVDSLQAESKLLYFLNDRSDLVKYNAVSALGFTKPRQAPGFLMELLRDKDLNFRKGAIVALGRYKWVPAIPQLCKFLDSSDSGVKPSATAALRQITGITFASAKDALAWHDAEKAGSLRRFDALAVQLDKLKIGPPETQVLLPIVIEQFQGIILLRDKVVETLLPYLGHQSFRVRAATCTVLGRTGLLSALPALVGRLSDPSPEVSYAAWRALKESTGRAFPRDQNIWSNWLNKRG